MRRAERPPASVPTTWPTAGVAPTQVAAWAGHSVEVLLRVYAECLDDTESIAIAQIEGALTPDHPTTTTQDLGTHRHRWRSRAGRGQTAAKGPRPCVPAGRSPFPVRGR